MTSNTGNIINCPHDDTFENMPTLAVIGSQWGDEGKGKIVDFLAEEADLVVRFQGGNNAGHSVKVGEELFKLHHLPSGILRPGKLAVIGNGVVLDPGVLIGEVEDLKARGMKVDNLRISDRAHVIMPYHRLLDGAEERMRKGDKVGTTGRGIGPAYSDKVARLGIRVGDLVDEEVLREKVGFLVPLKQKILDAFGDDTLLDAEKIFEEHAGYGRRLRPFVADTADMLQSALREGRRILLEGAQGTMLDVEHGTYPYVTSSSTVSANAAAGSGIPPTALDDVFGVAKAYTTRVGQGPMPTELKDGIGARMAERGGEFGTTTGRARRCGWLDLVVLRHSAALNGFTGIALTKVDVLGGMGDLRVCTHYRLDGVEIRRLPSDTRALERCEPRYTDVNGWPEMGPSALDAVLSGGADALPEALREYIALVEREVGVPVALVGLGRRRNEMLDLRERTW